MELSLGIVVSLLFGRDNSRVVRTGCMLVCVLYFMQNPSPDGSENPFYFLFKNKKIAANSGK